MPQGCESRLPMTIAYLNQELAMEDRRVLRNDQWDRIKDILPGKQGDRGRTAACNRTFVEAILWKVRTGSPWRDIPNEFGKWHAIYVRFSRWAEKGVWERVFRAISGDADFEYVMVDGSIVRVHQHGAAQKK